MEIAESYRARFAEKGVAYFINSKKDKGIYDGMNNGIELATGDYVYFLNAGDWFYSNDVIEQIVKKAKEENSPDVIYGNVATVERRIVTVKRGSENNLTKHMTMGHQAVFVASQCAKNRKFDLKYRITADYNMVLGLKLANASFSHIDLTIAYFVMGGVSTVRPKKYLKELFEVHRSNGIKHSFLTRTRLVIGGYKTAIVYALSSIVPSRLRQWYNVKLKKKQICQIKNLD